MKRIYIVFSLFFVSFLFSKVIGSNFDTYALPYFTSISGSISSLSGYQSCPEFTSFQKKFFLLKSFGFFEPFGKYKDFLHEFSSSTPKNDVQKVFYPYWNKKYADEKTGIWGSCKTESFHQGGGVAKLTGRVYELVSDAMLVDGEPISLGNRVYFAIKESNDQTFLEFPFVKESFQKYPRPEEEMYLGGEIEDSFGNYKSAFLLGCREQDSQTIRGLTQKVDTTKGQFFLEEKSIDKATSKVLRKSGYDSGKDISIYVYLDPNVYLDSVEYLPCNNPGISRIEIADTSSMDFHPIEGCLLDREGVCHPEWKHINGDMCSEEGGRWIQSDFFFSAEEYEKATQSGRFYVSSDCWKGQSYVGHLARDSICCKGDPSFS